MSILKLNEVSKSFGGLLAVNGVTIEVERESICGLIGPNGSGKTTLFNVISGLHVPDAGRVTFDTKEITGFPPHEVFRRGIYRTFQSPQIVSRISVLENVLLAGRAQSGEAIFPALLRRAEWNKQESQLVDKAFKILKFLELEKFANRSPSTLSGGQLKLLEVGRALMCEAKMLLLDEPAAGVNPSLARKILSLFEEMRKDQGTTIFIIEHRMELFLRRLDHVFVMNKGRLLFEGGPNEVEKEESVIEAYLGG